MSIEAGHTTETAASYTHGDLVGNTEAAEAWLGEVVGVLTEDLGVLNRSQPVDEAEFEASFERASDVIAESDGAFTVASSGLADPEGQDRSVERFGVDVNGLTVLALFPSSKRGVPMLGLVVPNGHRVEVPVSFFKGEIQIGRSDDVDHESSELVDTGVSV